MHWRDKALLVVATVLMASFGLSVAAYAYGFPYCPDIWWFIYR
jgi:hypothetical protein